MRLGVEHELGRVARVLRQLLHEVVLLVDILLNRDHRVFWLGILVGMLNLDPVDHTIGLRDEDMTGRHDNAERFRHQINNLADMGVLRGDVE